MWTPTFWSRSGSLSADRSLQSGRDNLLRQVKILPKILNTCNGK